MAPRSLSHVILVLGGAVAVLGSVLFVVWKAYFSDGSGRRRRPWWEAELSPYVGELDPDERQVLVLGLDGAGKSTILHCLSGHRAKERMAPTWGFNSVRLPTESFQMDLLEVGGSQNLRFYWKEFLSQADVLVFVVDSADRLRLPCARQELHMLLAEDPDLPVVVVANKQDKSEALTVAQLQQELDLQAFDQREFFLLPVSIPPAGPDSSPPSIHHVWTLLLDLLSQA